MKYSIIIPCYNEEENLENLINNLNVLTQREDLEIILVENGSKDNSKEKMKSLKEIDGVKIKSVFVPVNQGYGYGIIQGLKEATGKYVGWLHADLQVSPKEMIKLIDYIENNENPNTKYFLKGKRKNRSLYDRFFTAGMTVYESIVLGCYVNDNGAIPVLFDRELLQKFDKAPYNFSIELFSLYQAKKEKYYIKRFPVILEKREKGKSSWNKGLKSKIKLSIQMMKDGISIRKGEQVK